MIRHVLVGTFAAVVAIVIVAVAQPDEPSAVALGPHVVKIDELERFIPDSKPARRPPATTSAANPLDRPVVEINWKDLPLFDAIQFVREVTGANIVVSWHALKTTGVENDTPITLSLRDVTAGELLSAILKSAGNDLLPLQYHVRDRIVHVSTADYLRAESEIRLYNIRDIMIEAMRFHRSFDHAVTRREPPAAPPGPVTARAPKPHEIRWTEAELADNIQVSIRELVDPESWVTNGGRSGSSFYWAGKLLIVQTPENHEEIERFLNMLREE